MGVFVGVWDFGFRVGRLMIGLFLEEKVVVR